MRTVLLGAALVAASWFAFDGPVFVAHGAVPEPAADHAALEQRFAASLRDTEVVIVDTQTLSSRAAIQAYVAQRLNARGAYMNAAWNAFIDRVADPAFGARAVWRQFLGGRHGDGLLGYLRGTGVCVVTTGPEARSLAGQTGLSSAFWSRVVLVHELQHCVDADRGNRAGRGTMDTAAPAGVSGPGDSAPRTPVVSGRELYADAATALFLLREGVAPAALRRFAELRARTVIDALAQGRPPVWTHFTGPMLFAVLEDVHAGRLQPASLSDDEIHARARHYRDRALAEVAGISLPRLRAALEDGAADPKAALQRAGAPASWKAL